MTRPAPTAGTEIADTFGASGKPSGGTSNHPVAAASPARARGCPPRPGRWPRCRTQSMPASVRLPPEHGPSPLPRGPGLACPTCGHEPATRHEAVQQREDLAIVWLHLDGDHLTEAQALCGMPAARARHRPQLLRLRRRPPDHRAATRTRRPARAASAGCTPAAGNSTLPLCPADQR